MLYVVEEAYLTIYATSTTYKLQHGRSYKADAAGLAIV